MSINEKAWLNIRDIIAQAKWEQVRDYINRYEAAKATHQPVSTHTCTAPHETEAETVKYIESFAEQPDESPYKAFFDALWRAYCDQELQFEDANFIITAACKNGLAKEEKYDPNVHGEALGGEWGLEEGDSCYILAKQPKRESVALDVKNDRVCIGGKWYVPSGTEKDPVRKWQPIETAPKDGTFILAYSAERNYGGSGVVRWIAEGWQGRGRYHLNKQPTHWMPLPEIPRRGSDV